MAAAAAETGAAAKPAAPDAQRGNPSVGEGGPGDEAGPPPAPPLVIAPNGEHVLYKHVKRPAKGVWDASVGSTVEVKYESQRYGRPEPLDQKKKKKKKKKGKKDEKEEAEEEVDDPFKDHDEAFWYKRNFVNQLQSRRQFKANVQDPGRLYSHRVRRSPSLPSILVAPKDEETGQPAEVEPSILRLEQEKEPVVRRRRRLSGVVSECEQTAREITAVLDGEATQEGTDEERIMAKLAYWDAGEAKFELDMESKSLMKDDFYFLAHAMRFNFLLHKLNLSKCFVTDEDIELLATNLELNVVLSTLILRRTKVSDRGAAAIAKLIERNHTITTLDLRQTSLTVEGGYTLVTAYKRNPKLSTINGLPVDKLTKDPPDEIDFREYSLGAPEMAILLEVLRGRKNITSLNFHKNLLGPKASKTVVELLASLPNVKRVDLGENRFGCQGCEAIAPFLEVNTSIEYFDLSMNGAMLVLPQKTVDPKGLKAIADALKVNKTLKHLIHSDNDIDPDIGRWIDERIRVNRAIRHDGTHFTEYLDSLFPEKEEGHEKGGFELSLTADVDYLRKENMYLESIDVDKGAEKDGYMLHPATRKEQGKKNKTHAHVTEYIEKMEVMVRWNVDGRLYPGYIEAVNVDRTFNCRFMDGTVVTAIPRTDLRPGHRSREARWDP